MEQDEPIRFYGVRETPFGCFSNFSAHAIHVDGKTWPTTEHYFQAKKFENSSYEEAIRKSNSPMLAARMGRSRKHPLRKDWESVKETVMSCALHAKFTQHEDLRELLLTTGTRTIIEASPTDRYWGEGSDRTGKNRLGVLLMRLREQLRALEPS